MKYFSPFYSHDNLDNLITNEQNKKKISVIFRARFSDSVKKTKMEKVNKNLENALNVKCSNQVC